MNANNEDAKLAEREASCPVSACEQRPIKQYASLTQLDIISAPALLGAGKYSRRWTEEGLMFSGANLG